MSRINLQSYDNSWYNPGRSTLWRAAWLFAGLPLLRLPAITSSSFRVALLRFFGARIGRRVNMRHGFEVKYPWHLTIGDDCWIGEHCWIDNLTTVRIGNHVCVSQGAYLCTGNHNWSDPAFGLMIAPIQINDGAWAGAKCLLAPGTILAEGAVAAAGSVVSGVVPEYEIYSGNPAVFTKKRVIEPAISRDRESKALL